MARSAGWSSANEAQFIESLVVKCCQWAKILLFLLFLSNACIKMKISS